MPNLHEINSATLFCMNPYIFLSYLNVPVENYWSKQMMVSKMIIADHFCRRGRQIHMQDCVILSKINPKEQRYSFDSWVWRCCCCCCCRCPLPQFELKWGRVSVDDCSEDESQFPLPTMDGDAMFDYFKQTFGFDRQQVR